MKENLTCGCGYGDGAHHPLGEGKCCRYHVTEENEIPKNRRLVDKEFGFTKPVWIWDIADYWITEYTLFEQRLYSQDENGNWSRPKSKDSVNSLEGDW